MAYASGRRYQDADSHLMELPDFLSSHAQSSLQDRLPSLDEVGLAIESIRMSELRGQKGHPPDVVERLVALGDGLLKGPKWHDALGAFNGRERAQALDLLGFERQVVFSSFCATRIFGQRDLDMCYASCLAHNLGMAEFCDADPRLIGVGLVVLDDAPRALKVIEEGLERGLGAFWIPAAAPAGRSPGHPAHDAVWRMLAECGAPFILHVGSSPLNIADEWMNDGVSERQSARGRAEVIGSKDLMVIYQPFERFLSVLVLDGVLERFPDLRGAAIEVGAGWVPDMIRRLDHAVAIWSRSEPHLGEMGRKPSEQIGEQLRFTPYPFEDVGELIRASSPELYMFSSDYPHAEGGRDPLGRFERSLAAFDEDVKRAFYSDNFDCIYK
ncbi:MAG: amidohydrolase family protein [Gammaproteobacteria bacterium]|nr:amidohydrolase family protein [Gammaproteobacteria bacterium]